jgi:tetratricopeptide (TPR) repeat protein
VTGSAVLHFAGHGRSDAMRPLQSALEVHPDPERWQPVDNADPLLSLAGAAGFTEFKDNERWADVPGEGRLYERIFPVTRRTELRLEYGLRGTLLGQYANAGDPKEEQLSRLRLSELWSAGDLITGRLLDGCSLAFLSSCEAGQGGLTLGLDEHAGLPAAIELAGARAIVSPLWRVDDVASAVFAQLFYEGLLRSSGEIDLGTLVSRTRFSMRDMSAVEASRRVREIASVSKRGTTRFALEAEALRIERDSTPPFAEPLSWAAFYLTGASRAVVGVDAKGLRLSQPAEKLPRVDRTPHVATQVRPLVEAVPDAPQAQPDAPSQPVADLWLAVAKDSGNPDLVREAIRHLYERFQRRLKRQQIDAAGEDVTKILELDGNSAEAHDALGALALAKNDIDGAIGSLDRALEINPALVSAYKNRAKALLARLDPRRAIADCTTALDLAPRDRELLALRGMAWIAAGDPLSALVDFITGVQCDPDDPACYIGKAMVLAHLQRHEQALEACTEAIERRPEEGATYLQRSLSRAALNEVDKAFADCETAILLLPDSSSAYAQKGFLLAAVGELDLALEEYRRAIEANSGIPQIYFSRACVLSMSETAGTIVEDLEHAIGAHPQFRLLARMAPELEWARNNLDRVRELLADDDG